MHQVLICPHCDRAFETELQASEFKNCPKCHVVYSYDRPYSMTESLVIDSFSQEAVLVGQSVK